MIDKVILTIALISLSLFGFRGFLPHLPAMAITGLYLLAISTVFIYHITSPQKSRRIGEIAREKSFLTQKEIKQILYCQKYCGGKFGEVAVKLKLLTTDQLQVLLRLQPISLPAD